jgi:hypothetical protein
MIHVLLPTHNPYWFITTFPRITPVIYPLRYTYYQYRTNSIKYTGHEHWNVLSVYDWLLGVRFIGHALSQSSRSKLASVTNATRLIQRKLAVKTVAMQYWYPV